MSDTFGDALRDWGDWNKRDGLPPAASTGPNPDPENIRCADCSAPLRWADAVNVCIDPGSPPTESENVESWDFREAMARAGTYLVVCRSCAGRYPLEAEWRTAEMSCPICSFTWVATYPAVAKQLECKECGHMAPAP